MKQIRSAYGTAALSLSLLAFAADSSAQTHKAVPAAPAFEVISVKHTGNMQDGGRMEGGRQYFRPIRRLEYKGVRLSGEEPLRSICTFAFSPLLTPFRSEAPDWMQSEYYQIEAIAPAGTTIDGARAMLRTALAERLGFQYHLADRETPVYTLLRGNGELKLARSTETEPNPGAHYMGAFRNKSASLADFANFVSAIAGRAVIDKTGIQGLYKFDVDWTKEIQDERQAGNWDPRNGNPGIALAGVKKLGLKLEPGKELQKILVVDRVNKEPTAN